VEACFSIKGLAPATGVAVVVAGSGSAGGATFRVFERVTGPGAPPFGVPVSVPLAVPLPLQVVGPACAGRTAAAGVAVPVMMALGSLPGVAVHPCDHITNLNRSMNVGTGGHNSQDPCSYVILVEAGILTFVAR